MFVRTVVAWFTLAACSFAQQRSAISSEDPARAEAVAPGQNTGYRGLLDRARVDRFESQPGGRAAMTFVIDENAAEPVGSDSPQAPTRLDFVESWIVRTIKDRFADLDRVVVVHTETSRLAEDGATRATKAALEITGQRAGVESARDFLIAIARANRQLLQLSAVIIERKASAPAGGIEVEMLGDAAIATQLQLAESRDGGSDILMSPRLTLFAMQQGMISVMNEVSYVADFDVQAHADAFVVDPVIKTAHEGLTLDVTPIIDADGETLHLRVGLDIATLRKPIRTFTTTFAGFSSAPMTLQVPVVETLSWAPAEILLRAPDVALRVTGLRVTSYDESGARTEKDLEVLLQLRRVPPEPVSDAAGPDGWVRWWDPAQKLAAVECPAWESAHLETEQRVNFERAGSAVATGTLLGWMNGTLFVRVDTDAVKEGDMMRFATSAAAR